MSFLSLILRKKLNVDRPYADTVRSVLLLHAAFPGMIALDTTINRPPAFQFHHAFCHEPLSCFQVRAYPFSFQRNMTHPTATSGRTIPKSPCSLELLFSQRTLFFSYNKSA
jgi:hypothetical protein